VNRQDMIAVLPVGAPHALEAAVGYEGNSRCYGLFWTPDMPVKGTAGGWTVRVSDGYHEWPGDSAGWHTFVGHPLIAPHLKRHGFAPGSGSPAMILIVDREARVLLLYEFGAGLAFLAEQNTPWAASPEEEAGLEVEAAPDPYDSLPLEAVDLPAEPGDVWYWDDIPEVGLPLVEALQMELDRMQAGGAGRSPT
jgi:hypothetical protein